MQVFFQVDKYFYIYHRVDDMTFSSRRRARKKLLCAVIVLALCSCFTKFMTWQHNHRDAVIVHVPIEAFNDEGKLVDEKWVSYLKKHRPVGVIFFPEHFKKRDVSIKIISEIKKVLGERTFLAVDEEGGMIQRIPWMDIPSAMEVARKYSELKLTKGIVDAKTYVLDIYDPMFKEMKKLGLNMDFAPNLDISFANVDVNKDYAKAVEYMSITRTPIEKISFWQKSLYNEGALFKSYLNDIGERKLPSYELHFDGLWNAADDKIKQKLKPVFDKARPYANYAAVIGSRSYSAKPQVIAEVASIFMDAAQENGIKYVVKHALGHGRAVGDTHQGQQVIDVSKEELLNYDMKPYILLADKIKFVMPSHIIYSAIDDKPATASQKVLDFFRENVTSKAVFISDDMSMAGADSIAESPCEMLIISHKTVEEIEQMHVKRINIKDVEWI